MFYCQLTIQTKLILVLTTIQWLNLRDDVHDSDAVIYVEEHNKLEDALVNNPTEHQEGKEHYPVMITVSGESGIGKTTLVRDIYKKMEKKKVFEVQAMESFAPYLTAPNILQQITQQLT